MSRRDSRMLRPLLRRATAAAVLALACLPANADQSAFAAVMGYINVKDFGALGDGKTDDTAAIQAAIASLPPFTRKEPFSVKPIYFPAGTYVISQTISRRDASGRFAPTLALIGESQSNTVIRLSDHSRGFLDPSRPQPMVYFSSGLLGGPPTAGGKDYEGLGEGNDAYQNYVESLTLSTGRNNPGASGVDYLANNIGAIRNVKIVSPDRLGATGLGMTRKWIGPALIKNVTVSGFSVGLDIANTEYSITLDNVVVEGSRRAGLRNTANSVAFSKLKVSGVGGIGIENLTTNGLIVGREARIEGKLDENVRNEGYMNLVDVVAVRSSTDKATTTEKWDGVYGPTGRMANGEWHLSVSSTPETPNFPTASWANGSQFGAVPDVRKDSTVAFQRAMDSGLPVVCIPNGIYRITRPIRIPPTVKRIEGSFSIIYLDLKPAADAPQITDADQSSFVVNARRNPLFVEHLTLRSDINNASNVVRIAFLDDGEGDLIFRDVAIGEVIAIKRLPTAGKVWTENMIAGKFVFQGPTEIWMRQLNTEGKGIRIQNQGAKVWILGSKTENNMTLLENSAAGEVELFGGLAYMVHPDGRELPYIRNLDGRVVAAFAEEAFLPGAVYKTILESEKGGRKRVVKGTDLPDRHHAAHVVPQVAD